MICPWYGNGRIVSLKVIWCVMYLTKMLTQFFKNNVCFFFHAFLSINTYIAEFNICNNNGRKKKRKRKLVGRIVLLSSMALSFHFPFFLHWFLYTTIAQITTFSQNNETINHKTRFIHTKFDWDVVTIACYLIFWYLSYLCAGQIDGRAGKFTLHWTNENCVHKRRP